MPGGLVMPYASLFQTLSQWSWILPSLSFSPFCWHLMTNVIVVLRGRIRCKALVAKKSCSVGTYHNLPRYLPCQVPLQCFHQFHACLCYTCWPRPGCNSKSYSSATESSCFDLRFSRALCMCRGACVKVFRIGSWPGSLKISRLDYCAFREIHPPGRTKKSL